MGADVLSKSPISVLKFNSAYIFCIVSKVKLSDENFTIIYPSEKL